MGFRAPPSGIRLTEADIPIVKGMLLRGDRQHDIASWFGINPGRIADVVSGWRFTSVPPAPANDLPQPGPYLSGRDTQAALQALERAKRGIAAVENMIKEGPSRQF